MIRVISFFLFFTCHILGLTHIAFAQTMTTHPLPATSGYAPVNGLRMYYEVYGTGSMPLVLIHGGGSTIASNFGTVLPFFVKYGKVIAVELQAHGRTGDRDAPESFPQDADDVAALLRYLHIEKANFLGFSNGGSTALQIAIRHPALVHKIISASGAVRREGFIPGFFEGMPKATLKDMPAPLHTAFLDVNPDTAKLQVMFDRDKQRMVHFQDWPDESLRSINAPTLILAADHDVITVAHSLFMSQVIPRAQLAILPGMHGTYLGEICTVKQGSKLPEMTVNLVEEFLKE